MCRICVRVQSVYARCIYVCYAALFIISLSYFRDESKCSTVVTITNDQVLFDCSVVRGIFEPGKFNYY